MREPLKFELVDDVRRVDLAMYDEVLSRYLDALVKLPCVRSVYGLGSVRAPGISDIDLIVVVGDVARDTVDFSALQLEVNGELGRYLFSHPPYVVDAHTFRNLNAFFYADNLRHLWGEKLDIVVPDPWTDEVFRYLVALEAAIAQSFSFMRAVHNQAVFKMRSTLCNLNAVKHDFAALGPWLDGTLPENWQAYALEIDGLRADWFGLDRGQSDARVIALVHAAGIIMLEVLTAFHKAGTSRGFLSTAGRAGSMSLTEINVLMRFDNRTDVAVDRIRNPLRNLLLAPALSGIMQSNRRLREAGFDISVLQLPAEFLPVLSFWTDARAPVGKVLWSRVQGAEPARESEFGGKLFACLRQREQLLNGYLSPCGGAG